MHRWLQNYFVYGILGRVPMLVKRHCQIVKYWIKIIEGKKPPHVNVLYMSSLSAIDKGDRNNWTFNLRKLLCSNGFGDIWRAQGTSNPDGFYEAFKTRLHDIFKQEWSCRLSESPRATFYKSVIDNHCFNDALKYGIE